MMCVEWETRLNEYADGTLGPAERSLVEAHLATCAGCRAARAELADLLGRAGALPQSIEPGRELWTEIGLRIARRAPGTPWWRARLFWAGAGAAAASVILALGIVRFLSRGAPARSPTAQRSAAALADYDRATNTLAQALAGARERLRPETVTLVERNLQVIDAAIGEARDALARDPGNAELGTFVEEAYRRKVELLRWAASAATGS